MYKCNYEMILFCTNNSFYIHSSLAEVYLLYKQYPHCQIGQEANRKQISPHCYAPMEDAANALYMSEMSRVRRVNGRG